MRPPVKPDEPLPALEYDNYFTPWGTEVEAPGYIVERDDLFLLALQEIDNLNFHLEFPLWVIKLTPPDGEELVDRPRKRIIVRWRSDGHEPADQMLPNLQKLMDEAFDQ